MAEEAKKRTPPDPNSAKVRLGNIAAKAYSDAQEAKARGEKVGWCASNFPVEIPETLGVAVVYPENQAAAIAARGFGQEMCEVSEADGYSNDICAYARVSLAYAKLKKCEGQDVPMPDFLLCCNNICNCIRCMCGRQRLESISRARRDVSNPPWTAKFFPSERPAKSACAVFP